MTDIHFYLLAIGAICISGFSFGLSWGKQELNSRAIQRRSAAGVEKPLFLGDSISIPKSIAEDEKHEQEFSKDPSLLQLGLSFAILGYAIAWGVSFIDGAYLVWVPGFIAWFICNKKGKDFYCSSYKQHDLHLYISIVSTIVVVLGYHYLKSIKSTMLF